MGTFRRPRVRASQNRAWRDRRAKVVRIPEALQALLLEYVEYEVRMPDGTDVLCVVAMGDPRAEGRSPDPPGERATSTFGWIVMLGAETALSPVRWELMANSDRVRMSSTMLPIDDELLELSQALLAEFFRDVGLQSPRIVGVEVLPAGIEICRRSRAVRTAP